MTDYTHKMASMPPNVTPELIIIDLLQARQYIPLLAEWHHNEWAYLNPDSSLELRIEKMQAYLSVDPIPKTYVCLCHGQPAGSAAVVACDMDTHPELTPWLASVYVAPSLRRQGIGSALVKHALYQVGLTGMQCLYLFTPDRAAFYRKLGWQHMTQEYYRGHTVTLMQFDLRADHAPPANNR